MNTFRNITVFANKVMLVISFIFLQVMLASLYAQLPDEDTPLEGDSTILRSGTSSDTYSIQIPNIIPSTPQSHIFERYVNHPVTEYNGLPQIEIPLYEIEIKGMTIPVSLSYHAGGIKYNRTGGDVTNNTPLGHQYDGDVGAGWSINAGGYRVTRQVYGKPDEYTMYNEEELAYHLTNPSVSFYDREKFLSGIHYNDTYSPFGENGVVHYWDGEFDMFTYMLPSSNGHFIRDRQRSPQIIERNPDKISLSLGAPSSNIKIVDSNGFIYQMGGISEKTNINEHLPEVQTAWPVQKIISPYNEMINFEYDPFRFNRVTTAIHVEEPFTILRNPWHPNNKDRYVEVAPYKNLTYGFYTELLLTKITTERETVEFKRKNASVPANVIKKIEVKDKSGQFVREVEFEYYPITTVNWHNLLKSVTVKKGSDIYQKYEFEYYSAPPDGFYSTYPDQWGYYAKGRPSMTDSQKLRTFVHNEFLDYKILNRAYLLKATIAYDKKEIKNSVIANEFKKCAVPRSADNESPHYFSLKKITYPTGGTTEYVYEPHQYNKAGGISLNKSVKGGGQRIAKIISRADDNTPALITYYKYGQNEDGNGKANFNLTLDNFVNKVINIAFEPAVWMYDEDGFHSLIPCNRKISAVETFSTEPVFGELLNFAVNYERVSAYKYDEDSHSHNGKTISDYEIPVRYYSAKMDAVSMPTSHYYELFNYFNLHWNQSVVKDYRLGYKPVLVKRMEFDNTTVLKEEFFEYQSYGAAVYKGLKVDQKLFFSREFYSSYYPNCSPLDTEYTRLQDVIGRLFSYSHYSIHAGTSLLSSKTTKTYNISGSNPVIEVESYEYGDDYSQLKKSSVTNSTGIKYETFMHYPYDKTGTVYQSMTEKNIVSPVIEQYTTHNNTETARIVTEYTNSSSVTGGLFLPHTVSNSFSGAGNLITKLTYNKYNTRGNIREYTEDNGNKTVVLWGYSNRHPIAVIRNTDYSTVSRLLGADRIARMENATTPLDNDMSAVDNLRISTDAAMTNAQVSTLRYKPFIGMTSMTDPHGITTYYEYDSFGRVKEIKTGAKTTPAGSETKRNVESYDYHYKNR
ncbi:MAG: hypothetical protein LBV41_04045 [Cytophagaceae bacterium]|jgi:YD repeat-containing protein|nr:hypothetical protein [Cytophagaceae bacterium]